MRCAVSVDGGAELCAVWAGECGHVAGVAGGVAVADAWLGIVAGGSCSDELASVSILFSSIAPSVGVVVGKGSKLIWACVLSSAELALAWYGQLDCLEAASMNVLAHGPVVRRPL